MKPSIKICGICNQADALLAVNQGAQYLGLIFVQSSPRFIETTAARLIAQAVNYQAKIVGVFQNSTIDEINNVLDFVDLDYIQLHGNESPKFCAGLSKPVIKSFQINTENISSKQPCITLSYKNKHFDSTDLDLLKQYGPHCSHFLFDKVKNESSDNWLDLATRALKSIEDQLGQYFFSGGLNPQNVKTVLQKLNPATLDVASGVEQTNREKSKVLMKEFFNSVSNPKEKP